MNAAVEHDAREFGLHVKQGGWRLGLLVARNVEPGTGQGARQPRDDRPEVKVSANVFAEMSGVSRPRVTRHLDAWEKAAAKGYVPAADSLSPGEDIDLDVDALPDWNEFYDASKAGGYNGGDERQPTYENVKKAAAKLPAAEREKLGAEIQKEAQIEQKPWLDPEPLPPVSPESPGGNLAWAYLMHVMTKPEAALKEALKEIRKVSGPYPDDVQEAIQEDVQECRNVLDFIVSTITSEDGTWDAGLGRLLSERE